MTQTKIEWDDLQVTVWLGCFNPESGGAAEFHAMIESNAVFADVTEQFRILEEAVRRLDLKGSTLVWKHFFVSDAVNQSPYLTASADEAVSVVQQPPLNGSKASLWLYFVEDAQMFNDTDDATIMKRPHYTHLFNTQLHERSAVESQSPLMALPSSSGHQTNRILNRYSQSLSRHNCTLERNCIRTWIYVQDVDVQYAGMVVARREYFEHEGLTQQTHYIASTGIEGRYIYPDVLVHMDAYAIAGIEPAQVKYLHAPTHLNPTPEYGVTFERGTSVDYGARRHIFISGTASINNHGEIVHPLDVEKQTDRTFENVQALLAEAGANMSDVACMIVYLRDTADYATINRYINKNYPTIPRLMLLAPVCRPGWLVEIECIAIKSIDNMAFAAF
jgi:enamine deaminase RidA (YjgF/YER057c/UK114 family)